MPYRNPEVAREYQREYRRISRAGGGTTPCTSPVPVTFRLKTAADVVALVEEQVQAVREDQTATTLEKARVVGYLASVSLRAIEAGDMAARVEALESVLTRRATG